jgi:hypothetical protein
METSTSAAGRYKGMRLLGSQLLLVHLALAGVMGSGVAAEEGTSPTPAPETQPAMDCGLFSMEGIRPGMTLEDVKAKGIEVKAKHAFVPPELEGKVFRFRGEKHNGTLTFDETGTVKSLTVDFTKSGFLSVKADVDYDAMVTILSERWGPPVSNESTSQDLHNAFNAVIGKQVTRSAGWDSHECRRVATMLYMKYSTSVLTEVLSVTLARDMSLDELEAEATKREKVEQETREKVKF